MVEHTLWEGLATSVGTKVSRETWEQTKRSMLHKIACLMGTSGTNIEEDTHLGQKMSQYHIGMAPYAGFVGYKKIEGLQTHYSNMISSNEQHFKQHF